MLSQETQIDGPSPQEILRGYYAVKVVRNPYYSLRAFARDMGISHSHLSRIFSLKKRLSIQQGIKIADRLKLEVDEKERFVGSVTRRMLVPFRTNGKSGVPQEVTLENSFQLEVDRFRVISEWYHCAIIEMMSQKKSSVTARNMAARLGLSLETVKSALERLEKLGLIARKNGKFVREKRHLQIPTEHAETVIREFHSAMIHRALEATQDSTDKAFASRDIAGITVLLDPSRIQEAKQRIIRFRRQMMKFLAGGKPSVLYQMNTQFFRLEKRSR